MRDTGNNIVKDLEAGNQDKVDSPGSFGTGPVGIEVRKSSLVTDLLKSLWGLMVDLEDTTRSPPPGTGAVTRVSVRHVEINAASARRFGTRVVGDGSL